ncbi:uncharacterized protein LOC107614975 [Arachis ipaensis]|uniref:uncharacterized protein LOC107614975 n=1 Tax=Arachis ipaensis TaxID=130454 RepID=UPI0007AF8C2D|nr:uncharacterized protein LOC107614975 [Arachis ipaensis]
MWNCRGLGKPLTVHNIKGIVKSHSPEVLFLCETKNNTSHVERVIKDVGFSNLFCLDPIGHAGGLMVAWKEETRVQIKAFESFLVHFAWEDSQNAKTWEVFAVHLHTDETIREAQFGQLLQIMDTSGEHRLVVGDFNAIKAHHEKEGGRMKSASSIQKFNDFIKKAELVDMGYEGKKFTWSNRQFGGNFIQERLDRALVSTEWRAEYPNGFVSHLDGTGSDHCPLLLNSEKEERRSRRRFRFQERWCDKEEVSNIVKHAWDLEVVGSSMFKLATKLKHCRHKLYEWQKSADSNSKQQIRRVQGKLEEEKEKGAAADGVNPRIFRK